MRKSDIQLELKIGIQIGDPMLCQSHSSDIRLTKERPSLKATQNPIIMGRGVNNFFLRVPRRNQYCLHLGLDFEL